MTVALAIKTGPVSDKPPAKPLREQLQERLGALQAARQPHEEEWQRLNAQFPVELQLDTLDPNTRDIDTGEGIYDATGLLAVDRAVAGLMSYATSPAKPWFRSVLPDAAEAEPDAKVWLDQVTELQQFVLQRSNAYRVFPMVYRSMLVVGMGALMVVPDFATVIHCHYLAPGTFWIGRDSHGRPDTCFRRFWMTIGQMAEQFGPDSLSTQARRSFDAGKVDEWRCVVHAIQPRKVRDTSSPWAHDMPWMSVYYESDTQEKDKVLQESGFRRFPVVAPRWQVLSETSYGTGACSVALPFVHQLQLMADSMGRMLALEADPSLQVPTACKNLDTSPGSRNYYDQSMPHNGVRRLVEQQSDPSWLRNDIDKLQMQVQQALFVDLFLMLSNDTKDTRRTAYEAAQITNERMLVLGPSVQNMHDEFLVPFLELVYGACEDARLIPPVPATMAGRDFSPEFTSVLFQAMRSIGANATDRLLAMVGGLAQATGSGEVWDYIDLGKVIARSSDQIGVANDLLVPEDDVQRLREARAQAEAAKEQAAMMQQQATTARDLAAAPMNQPNALTQLVGYGG